MSQDFPLDKNINLPAIGTSPGPDTMATTGQPRRSFLDLPAEIRFGVYQKLFTGAKLEVFETACGQNVRRAAGFEHHILLTCRQVRTEALPLLQSETTISYFCYGWNDTIPTHYLSGIKVLSITATCLTGYDCELSIAAHLDELPALKIMHVESCDLTYEGHTELTAEVQLISSPEYDPELLQEINRWVALDKDILAQVIDLPKRSFIVVLHAVFAVELFELTFRNLEVVVDVDNKVVVQKMWGSAHTMASESELDSEEDDDSEEDVTSEEDDTLKEGDSSENESSPEEYKD